MSDETIAARKAELLAAGYVLHFDEVIGLSRAIAPDGWEYELRFSASEPQYFIPNVYTHFQQQRELESLRRFKALSMRVFEYPRELDMMAASLSMEDRAWLKAQYEGKE